MKTNAKIALSWRAEKAAGANELDTAELARLISAYVPHDGSFELRVPGLHASRFSRINNECVHALRVPADEERENADDEARVRHEAVAAASEELDRKVADDEEPTPEHVVRLLRTLAEHHQGAAEDWIEDQEGGRVEAFQRLLATMLDVERQVFVAALDAGEIDDEVLRRVLRELDLRQASVDTP